MFSASTYLGALFLIHVVLEEKPSLEKYNGFFQFYKIPYTEAVFAIKLKGYTKKIHFLEDFIDAESFKKYWLSSKVEELFKRITTMPSRKCLNCKDRQLCGGGCCIQWFASDFESYNNYLLTIKSNLNGKD